MVFRSFDQVTSATEYEALPGEDREVLRALYGYMTQDIAPETVATSLELFKQWVDDLDSREREIARIWLENELPTLYRGSSRPSEDVVDPARAGYWRGMRDRLD